MQFSRSLPTWTGDNSARAIPSSAAFFENVQWFGEEVVFSVPGRP
jgi:hypothetical protein